MKNKPVKNRSKKKIAKVLAFDLGGTKVAVGVVNDRGKILDEIRTPIELKKGKEAVFDQLTALAKSLLQKHPECKKVGVASAGPLHPEKGILLDPTNFKSSSDETWGEVPLVKILSRRLKKKVFLENDAAAAILAERWVGAAKGFQNSMILTLGTGLGTGIISNGELVRAGRGLHPEAGHIIIKADDPSALCGCGLLGCAEAYLSGVNFAKRFSTRFARSPLTAKEITEFARENDPSALQAFSEYAHYLAIALQNYVVCYVPEIIVLTGSFSAASDLFLDQTKSELERLLVRRRDGIDHMPKLSISSLENTAGLLGGAYVALVR